MAKNLLVGVGSKARKVKSMYVGVGGKARKVKKVYVGVGGKARLVYTSYVAVTGVKLEIASKNGNTCIIKAVFTPANATNRSVKWAIGGSSGIRMLEQNAMTVKLSASMTTGRISDWLMATTPDGISCTYLIVHSFPTGWEILEN